MCHTVGYREHLHATIVACLSSCSIVMNTALSYKLGLCTEHGRKPHHKDTGTKWGSESWVQCACMVAADSLSSPLEEAKRRRRSERGLLPGGRFSTGNFPRWFFLFLSRPYSRPIVGVVRPPSVHRQRLRWMPPARRTSRVGADWMCRCVAWLRMVHHPLVMSGMACLEAVRDPLCAATPLQDACVDQHCRPRCVPCRPRAPSVVVTMQRHVEALLSTAQEAELEATVAVARAARHSRMNSKTTMQKLKKRNLRRRLD